MATKSNSFFHSTISESLKSSPGTKLIPVIILTMLGQDKNVEKGLALGVVDYFVKYRYPAADIVEKIRALFSSRSALSGGSTRTKKK